MAQRHCRRAPVEVIRTRSFDEVVATYHADPVAMCPFCGHYTDTPNHELGCTEGNRRG